jgi:hypothetical protein
MRTLAVNEIDAVSGGVWVWPAIGAIGGALEGFGEALEDDVIEQHEVLEICGSIIAGAIGGGIAGAFGKAAKAGKAAKGKKKGG